MRTVSILVVALLAGPSAIWGVSLPADQNEAAEAVIKALELHLASIF